MKLGRWFATAALILGAGAGILLYPQNQNGRQTGMPQAVTFRVSLGVGDTQPVVWDGGVKISEGKIISIQGWRFAQTDETDYHSNWKASTRHQGNPAAIANGQGGPVLENGVFIAASSVSPQARFDVQTQQGGFSFTAGEVPFGEAKPELGGRVEVERVPNAVQLDPSPNDQDFPAIAQSNDEVFAAYIEFTPGLPDRVPYKEEPKSFDSLATPAGGDQVKLVRFSKSNRTWSAPENVSAPHQDCMRAAVAVDGRNRVWVIWSANRNGNFDIFAKSLEHGRWSSEMRLTSDPGNDLNPVAATDSQGRVWVAWQAFRNNNLEILAAVQESDKFSAEQTVSFSPMSDWDPAIAAASNGEVAVAWDTYDKGDYDVYFRRMRYEGGVKMQTPVPVAASRNFEARASIAYDSRNRLWVAYESAHERWGKDFGVYEKSGISLYQSHDLAIKCFEGNNAFAPAEDLVEAISSIPTLQMPRRAAARMARVRKARGLLGPAGPNAGPRNTFPRVGVDRKGTVFVTFRSRSPGRSPAGTIWQQYITYLDNGKWAEPILVPHSDGLLDLRPAIAGIGAGNLMMIGVTDHRQSVAPGARRRPGELKSDVYAVELKLDRSSPEANLKALPAETAAAPQNDSKAELSDIAAMHQHRVQLAGVTLQVMRGEFHRHTEISVDGVNDGPLVDAYRYLIDAASMDWAACCDHDNGGGHEYFWWQEQKLTDAYRLGDKYVAMFGYERSVRYPEGHRNFVAATRGIRPLPRLPKMGDDSAPAHAPDTQMLYRYLKHFNAIVASHTSGTDMGTDWRDNDPLVEPVVEIYQGDRQNYEMPGAPRSNSEGDSVGGWRPLGFVSLALKKGYRLGFEASSDHVSTHISYCNLWVTSRTREGIMEAFHKRRIYGSTDNILADVRCGSHFMGEEFSISEPPAISVKFRGTSAFAKVHIVKDGNYVYSIEPGTQEVNFDWRDSTAERGKTSYYYVRGEQKDGELVWASPMWIHYQ